MNAVQKTEEHIPQALAAVHARIAQLETQVEEVCAVFETWFNCEHS